MFLQDKREKEGGKKRLHVCRYVAENGFVWKNVEMRERMISDHGRKWEEMTLVGERLKER